MDTDSIQKPKRKAISKKTRFEVFKRDGFACQYCGAHPPEVVLHVDHINPVANGGTNEMDNLITSCQPCNLGKSTGFLTDVPKSLRDRAKEIQEKEDQIIGYQRVMHNRRVRIEDEAEAINEVFEENCKGYSLTESAMRSVKYFIERIGYDAVYDAMDRACTYPKIKKGKEFLYFCGICWRIIKEQPNGN